MCYEYTILLLQLNKFALTRTILQVIFDTSTKAET